MKTKQKIQKALTLIITGVIFVGFQNWNYMERQIAMAPVNEEVRLAHAKELLGKSTRQIENVRGLNQHILNRMTERLPAAYKKLAPQIAKTLIEESAKAHFDPVFVMAIIETESKFNPKARGLVGEIGLMQVRPETAAWMAKKFKLTYKGAKSLEYPSTNIKMGIAYMTYLRNSFSNSAYKYVSAYNVGPKKLRRLIASKRKPQEYTTKVMGNYKDFYNEITTGSKTVIAKAGF